MPWISKYKLIKYINANDLEKEIDKYPKRAKKSCGCDCDQNCDCVLFGLYDDYNVEYEYYIN